MNTGNLLSNTLLLSALIAWLVAQILKTLIHLIVNKELDLTRLVGDGGLPSAHSATVCGLATAAAYEYGLGSFQFAITAILAIIVMHDAMGVRRESGKHAVLLNEMMKYLDMSEFNPDEALKEMLGHTPTQVVAGAIVGIIVASVLGTSVF